MTDYLPLLSRAVTGLERNSPEARRAVYDRARQALLKQLRSMNPPLAESEITRERLALEEAIRRIEAQTVRPPERAAPPPPPPPPPSPSPAPAPRAPAAPVSHAPVPEAPLDLDDAFAVQADHAAPTPSAPPAAPARREAPRRPVVNEAPARPSPAPGRSGTLVAPPAPRRPAAPPPPRQEIHDDPFHIEEPIAPPAAPAPMQPRGPRMPEPSLNGYGDAAAPSQSQRPGPFRGRSVDYAKADAQKAMKAKLIVGGTIGGLIFIMLVIGFLHRDRIFSMGTGASRPPASQSTTDEPPKASDRVASDTSTQQSSRPSQSQSGIPAAVAQRAVLYEENPSSGGQQLQTFVGTVVWKTETISPGPGRPPELGLRIEIEIPDRKMSVMMTIRRNPDTTLPASHTVEVQFTTPGDPFGGVSNVPGLRAKTTETAQGAPLSGLVVRVMPGFFLIGLSAIDADREQNLTLLRERGWLDLPFVYNNGRRAVLVIEKGAPGERVVNEAVAAWGG